MLPTMRHAALISDGERSRNKSGARSSDSGSTSIEYAMVMVRFANIVRTFATLVMLALSTHVCAQSSTESPAALIERISGEVFEIARDDRAIRRGDRQRILEVVREKIVPHIDFERMTMLTAGRFWRVATPEQQRRLTMEFRDLLVHVYSGALAQVTDERLVVKPLRGTSGKEAIVYSSVIRRGAEPVHLNYRLRRGQSGWKIYDISILGMWLVQSYRNTFANEIRRSGIDGLIEALATKNRRLAAERG